MKFIVGNHITLVEERSRQTDEWLDHLLRARPRGFQFDPRFRRRIWDGYVHAYHRGIFPSGHLPAVIKAADLQRLPFTIEDTRGAVPKMHDPVLKKHTPRAFQLDAVSTMLGTTLPTGHAWPRGILRIGTAGGKTLVMALLASIFRDEKVVVLTHRRLLLDQLARELGQYLGEPVGRVGGGVMQWKQRVVVAMVQTVAGSEMQHAMLAKRTILLADEVQRAAAPQWATALRACNHALVRVGVSGTPHDINNPAQILGVRGGFGELRFTYDARQLVEEKIVAPVTVHFRVVNAPQQVPCNRRMHASWYLPWAEVKMDGVVVQPAAYDALIVENEVRNRMIAEFVAASTAPTLVLVSRTDHGQRLAELTGAPFIYGEDDGTRREEVFDALRAGTIPCVIASTIADEGLDIPQVRRVVLAGGGRSEIRTLQRIGRGMRKTHADDQLDVLDFLDGCHPNLARHSQARVKAMREAGYTVRLDEGKAA